MNASTLLDLALTIFAALFFYLCFLAARFLRREHAKDARIRESLKAAIQSPVIQRDFTVGAQGGQDA